MGLQRMNVLRGYQKIYTDSFWEESMNKIKAIILDLDGTLLDDNKKISYKTTEYLKQIKNKVKIILASARQFGTIKPYLENLDLLEENNYTICFNGS